MEFSQSRNWVKKDSLGKYSLIDTLGKEIIPPTYEEIKNLSIGIAKVGVGTKTVIDNESEWGFEMEVKKAEKYGLIDTFGREIIAPIYEEIKGFSQGRAWIKKDSIGKYSLIDQSGRQILPPSYEKVENFSQGKAKVANDGKI